MKIGLKIYKKILTMLHSYGLSYESLLKKFINMLKRKKIKNCQEHSKERLAYKQKFSSSYTVRVIKASLD